MVVTARPSYIEHMDENLEIPSAPIDEGTPDEESPSSEPQSTPTSPPRLYRSSSRHIIGGVAGGLGERFDIDANVVRVVFVVLTCIGGLGVAIYLAMWVLIPRASSDGTVTPERERPPVSTSPWLLIALVVGVVVSAAIFLSVAAGGARIGPGLAFSWLIFLVVVAIVWLRAPARRLTFGRFFSIVFLGIVSLVILLSGAFLGFLVSTGVPITGGNGARSWQPTSIAQVRSSYRTQFGSANLDLSNVKFPVTGKYVVASVSAGVLNVELPSDVIVNLKSHTGAGRVSLETIKNNYVSTQFYAVPPSLTTANQAKAPHLTLDAEVGVGSISITRVAAK
jgi:phage shock protein PspC (stress-responsive transcriptional regulator)